MGIDWNSGCYGGPSTTAHIPGAWRIYHHSGDKDFLREAYEFYRELLADGIKGEHFGYAMDAAICLSKMATELEYGEYEAQKWMDMINIDYYKSGEYFEKRWDDTNKLFLGNLDNINWINFAYMGMSLFPDDYAKQTAERWLKEGVEDGLFTDIPLSTVAKKNWDKVSTDFAITPDTNWYMHRGLYLHNVNKLANNAYLTHLKKYNMNWGIPIAPEGYRKDFTLFGDTYNNFNSGNLDVMLEGIGGFNYSVVDNVFTQADTLPEEWSFMEFYVPIRGKGFNETKWVHSYVSRNDTGDTVTKNVTVETDYFQTVILKPWNEDIVQVESSAQSDNYSFEEIELNVNRTGYKFSCDQGNCNGKASVSLQMRKGGETDTIE